MRVYGTQIELDQEKTRRFFEERAEKYDEKNPYTTIMYQDKQPELVEKRNRNEIETIMPLLQLDDKSDILDIACGIGRWADAIQCQIGHYTGVDISSGLIAIARQRNQRPNFQFFVGAATDISDIANITARNYNKIISAAICMYLNDSEVEELFRQISLVAADDCTLYIREPIAFETRLTLQDFYSEDLGANYNAIYRTCAELESIFDKTLFENGFEIQKQAFMFSNRELNNRTETTQYYYIMQKCSK